MKCYRKSRYSKGVLRQNACYEGETIEQKVQRITTNKEPIKDGAPIIFTDRKDGVLPEYNIKTDRWEVAVEAMDKVSKSIRAKRDGVPTMGEQAKEGMEKEKQGEQSKDGGAESIQATTTE